MPKLGFITGSVFNNVMTKTVGKTVIKECCRIACERLGVEGLEEQFDIGHVRAIEWGNEMEPLARAAYEAYAFASIEGHQEWRRLDGRMVGGHVDGLVDAEGIVEIKCPSSANHLLNLTQDEQLGDYIHQIQAYLWITDRRWCDFVSFDPRFPEPLQLHVRRVERDEALIEAIDARAELMEQLIDEMVAGLAERLPSGGDGQADAGESSPPEPSPAKRAARFPGESAFAPGEVYETDERLVGEHVIDSDQVAYLKLELKARDWKRASYELLLRRHGARALERVVPEAYEQLLEDVRSAALKATLDEQAARIERAKSPPDGQPARPF